MGIIKRRHLIHIPFIVAALVVAGIYYFRTANPDDSRPFGPGMFQGPPPMMQEGSMPPLQPMDGMAPPRQDMRPPMDGNRPPMDGMRPDQMPKDGPRPMRPETMKYHVLYPQPKDREEEQGTEHVEPAQPGQD